MRLAKVSRIRPGREKVAVEHWLPPVVSVSRTGPSEPSAQLTKNPEELKQKICLVTITQQFNWTL